MPGPSSGRRPPTAHGARIWRTPSDAQRPQVGPVRDPVRRKPVIATVPGQERHRPAADLGDRDRVGRRAVRRVDRVLAGAVEQRVEAGSADHRQVGPRLAVLSDVIRHEQTLTATPPAGYRARHGVDCAHGDDRLRRPGRSGEVLDGRGRLRDQGRLRRLVRRPRAAGRRRRPAAGPAEGPRGQGHQEPGSHRLGGRRPRRGGPAAGGPGRHGGRRSMSCPTSRGRC